MKSGEVKLNVEQIVTNINLNERKTNNKLPVLEDENGSVERVKSISNQNRNNKNKNKPSPTPITSITSLPPISSFLINENHNIVDDGQEEEECEVFKASDIVFELEKGKIDSHLKGSICITRSKHITQSSTIQTIFTIKSTYCIQDIKEDKEHIVKTIASPITLSNTDDLIIFKYLEDKYAPNSVDSPNRNYIDLPNTYYIEYDKKYNKWTFNFDLENKQPLSFKINDIMNSTTKQQQLLHSLVCIFFI